MGNVTLTAFPVEIDQAKTVAYFKEVIRTEKATEFDDIAAVKLTLWTVSILDDDGDDGLPILISSVSEKRSSGRLRNSPKSLKLSLSKTRFTSSSKDPHQIMH